jgi:(4S)-4-hydroxy-5-phosphonooxypentane-2,3-dione isomerase
MHDQTDRSHVVLVEVCRDEDAAAAHKLTQHYAVWRDAVADMIARPRSAARYTAVFLAGSEAWESSTP